MWLAPFSKLVLPAVSPACQDPTLGVRIGTFSAVLGDKSSYSLGAVHLVPAPTTHRRGYLLLQSISWLCFVQVLLILLGGSLPAGRVQECVFPSLMVV